MKFALLEMKVALVRILRKFEIQKSQNTPEELEFVQGIVRVPKNGVKVILKQRV